jgi:hypothetical protein
MTSDWKQRRAKYALRTESEVLQERERLYPTKEKPCTGCKRTLPLVDFVTERGRRDGLSARCRDCSREILRRYNEGRRKKTPKEQKAYRKRKYGSVKLSAIKVCGGCHRSVPLDEFVADRSRADAFDNRCKRCARQRAVQQAEHLASIRSAAKKEGCGRCGWTGNRCGLHLAHNDPSEKLKNASGKTVNPAQIRGVLTLLNELQVTTPLCANCHRIEHYVERDHDSVYYSPAVKKLKACVEQEKQRRGACIDCKLSVTDVPSCVFDFDHKPGTNKKWNVSDMMRANFSEATVETEMEKCDMRCARCHLVKTEERRLLDLSQRADSDKFSVH